MTVTRGRYYPDIPPKLDGETDDTYTDRLTGADGTNRRPYDHRRGRECAIGFHLTCRSDSCECPHHTDPGMDTIGFVEQAETFAGLYYLPLGTAARVMHVAHWAVVNDGVTAFTALKDRLAAEYETELGDWFVVDVVGILGLTENLDGVPKYSADGR